MIWIYYWRYESWKKQGVVGSHLGKGTWVRTLENFGNSTVSLIFTQLTILCQLTHMNIRWFGSLGCPLGPGRRDEIKTVNKSRLFLYSQVSLIVHRLALQHGQKYYGWGSHNGCFLCHCVTVQRVDIVDKLNFNSLSNPTKMCSREYILRFVVFCLV